MQDLLSCVKCFASSSSRKGSWCWKDRWRMSSRWEEWKWWFIMFEKEEGGKRLRTTRKTFHFRIMYLTTFQRLDWHEPVEITYAISLRHPHCDMSNILPISTNVRRSHYFLSGQINLRRVVKYLHRVREEENLWKTCTIQPFTTKRPTIPGVTVHWKYNAKIVTMTKLFSFSKIYKVTSVGSNFKDIKG